MDGGVGRRCAGMSQVKVLVRTRCCTRDDQQGQDDSKEYESVSE